MKNKNAKDDFMDAFWILYEKKKIEKISVRELCELAGYNRTTFYVYFKDIYDLLEQFIKGKVLPDLSEIEVPAILSNLQVIQNVLCYMFERNNQYIQVILKNHHGYILQEIMVERIKISLKKEMEEEVEYIVRYQISAILGVLEFWHKQGEEQISKERLLTLIYEISTKGVLSSFVEKVL